MTLSPGCNTLDASFPSHPPPRHTVFSKWAASAARQYQARCFTSVRGMQEVYHETSRVSVWKSLSPAAHPMRTAVLRIQRHRIPCISPVWPSPQCTSRGNRLPRASLRHALLA
ncbi:hypothetical protein B0H14DRAFT_2563819 [Mycena olivaceomarginata]|nr:hypothetical protein B0H14DRAFT_2563819 [Mycena olivaceomarginata]